MNAPPSPRPLPAGPLIAFYGDDYTGSSAAMEVLERVMNLLAVFLPV
jgi:3-oxoisoapionate kinase